MASERETVEQLDEMKADLSEQVTMLTNQIAQLDGKIDRLKEVMRVCHKCVVLLSDNHLHLH